jgi:hypothetical protein
MSHPGVDLQGFAVGEVQDLSILTNGPCAVGIFVQEQTHLLSSFFRIVAAWPALPELAPILCLSQDKPSFPQERRQ